MLSIAARYARRAESRKLALEVMARHALHGWTFNFNKRKRTLGLCRYEMHAIELSIYLVDRNSSCEPTAHRRAFSDSSS
jgi:hypothetical protein